VRYGINRGDVKDGLTGSSTASRLRPVSCARELLRPYASPENYWMRAMHREFMNGISQMLCEHP